MFNLKSLFLLPILCFLPSLAMANHNSLIIQNGAQNSMSWLAILVFVLAYLMVMTEEFSQLKKSKPVIIGAGLIWLIVAIVAHQADSPALATEAIRHNILEYAELFLFLLVAMTYINALQERQVFSVLRAWLINHQFSYRQLFWLTGVISFFLSAVADNLTTALIMCTVITSVGKENTKFIALGCINIVVAANAGGAFCPFGDITTLMVWQKGIVPFQSFFHIFWPSVINYLLPALCMAYAVPTGMPPPLHEDAKLKFGAKRIVALFALTIMTAVAFHHFFDLPPVAGMMLGLGYVLLFSYFISMRSPADRDFDIFKKVEQAEWDTLLFFYGVVLCVGGLATLGYLEIISNVIYTDWGRTLPAMYQHTPANIIIGLLSAIVDNIPVMFAVLTMEPHMSQGQWLLVTLTAGVGGSLLSIGSAAGVAVMGQSKGCYTFFSHLKWTWAIFLGYAASILFHLWWNKALF